jgi:hypothetical protein
MVGGRRYHFDWQLFAFDFDSNRDETADTISISPTGRTGDWWTTRPRDPTATLRVEVRDPEVKETDPLGLMLVDFNGKPGEGQA